MGKNSAPSSPDPHDTANAQADANIRAIRESANISAVNQVGPTGSTTYQRDANGVPTQQTVSLNPGEQQFYDRQTGLRNSLAGNIPTGAFQAPGAGGGDAVEQALYQRKLGMVQPQLDKAQNDLNLQLNERGIPIGSQIYNNEQNRIAQTRGDTLASISQDATLAGGQERTRQLQDALSTYNVPFNALSSIQNGTPVANPQFQSTPNYQVAAPDISGLITQDYANRNQSYNQQNSSFLNGLFGLGSSALGLLGSDRRIKRNIKRVGYLDNGLPVYSYRYKAAGSPYMIGVMAQDVENVIPEAVVTIGGIKMVNYETVARAVGG